MRHNEIHPRVRPSTAMIIRCPKCGLYAYPIAVKEYPDGREWSAYVLCEYCGHRVDGNLSHSRRGAIQSAIAQWNKGDN